MYKKIREKFYRYGIKDLFAMYIDYISPDTNAVKYCKDLNCRVLLRRKYHICGRYHKKFKIGPDDAHIFAVWCRTCDKTFMSQGHNCVEMPLFK